MPEDVVEWTKTRASPVWKYNEIFSNVRKGNGVLLLLRSEESPAGSELIVELANEARRLDFGVSLVTVPQPSSTPCGMWNDALGQLNLRHAIKVEDPPDISGLYILCTGGRVAARAERQKIKVDPEIFGAMSSAAADFLSDSFQRATGRVEGDIVRFAHGGFGVCVVRREEFSVNAVFEGQETQGFLQELRALANDIELQFGRVLRSWDGSADATKEIGTLLSQVLATINRSPSKGKQVHEPVLSGLISLVGSRPVMIGFDGLHHADAESLFLLHQVAKGTMRHRLLLVGHFSPGELGLDRTLLDSLRAMNLDNLGVDDFVEAECWQPAVVTRVLVRRLVGQHALPSDLLDAIAEETLGHRALVSRVIARLRETNAIGSNGGDPSVRLLIDPAQIETLVHGYLVEAISERLSRVPVEARAVMKRAAEYSSDWTQAGPRETIRRLTWLYGMISMNWSDRCSIVWDHPQTLKILRSQTIIEDKTRLLRPGKLIEKRNE